MKSLSPAKSIRGNRFRKTLARLESLESRTLLSGVMGYTPDSFISGSGTYDSAGRLWFANINGPDGGDISQVINGVIVNNINVGDTRPKGLVASPDGKLFFIDDNTGAIDEVDPSNPTAAPIAFLVANDQPDYSETPTNLTVSGNGAVWFTALGAATPDGGGIYRRTDVIGRLDPSTGRFSFNVVNTTDSTINTAEADSISAVGSDSVYIGFFGVDDFNFSGTNRIGTATFSGGSVNITGLYAINSGDANADTNGYLTSVATAPDGSLWFNLANIDVSGDQTLRPQDTRPVDRLVHATLDTSDNQLLQTGYSLDVHGATSDTPLFVNSLAVDGNGRVWFNEDQGNATGYLDTHSTAADPFTTFALPDGPGGPTTAPLALAVSQDPSVLDAWVTTESDGYTLLDVQSDPPASGSTPPASPAIATTPSVANLTLGTSPATLTDTAVLSGGNNETGTITFTLYRGSTLLDTETANVSGNGSYSTPTGYTLPTTGTVTGTYQWDASYSGDANNNAASDTNDSGEQVVVNPATSAITSLAGGSVIIGSGAKLTDSATLAGGYAPAGTITFTLTGPGNTVVDTETVPVNGNGSYSTPSGYLPTAAGSYVWSARYNGNGNNAAATDNGLNESEMVNRASPAITMAASPSTVTLGSAPVTLKGTAVLSGGFHETGSIIFTLYSPSNAVVDTESVTVTSNGTYTTPTGYVPTVPGTYEWVAVYSGNANNNSAISVLGNAPVTVLPAPNVITILSNTIQPLFLGLVDTTMTFSDSKTASASQFTVSVNWGDGTTSNALVVSNPFAPGTFFVLGLHLYQQRGTYSVTTTISSSVTGTSVVLDSVTKSVTVS